MFEDAPSAAILLALAVTLHNIEEWIWLPEFPGPPALRPPSPFAFRFAVAAVTLVFWTLAGGLAMGLPLEPVLAGFAAAMILNAIAPHLAASIWFRRYHPGTGTAWLLVVPAALKALSAVGWAERFNEPPFALGAAAGLIGLGASVPLLIWLGRQVELRWPE
jgi:hypothetical protein